MTRALGELLDAATDIELEILPTGARRFLCPVHHTKAYYNGGRLFSCESRAGCTIEMVSEALQNPANASAQSTGHSTPEAAEQVTEAQRVGRNELKDDAGDRHEAPVDDDRGPSAKPETVRVDADSIPVELKAGRRFVLWRWELRGKKWTKPPYQANGELASSTDPDTWCTFDQAMAAYRTGKFDGIGRVQTGDADDSTGVDLDHVRDPETGELSEEATRYVEMLDSYTEVSPSRCGLRIFLRGDLARDGQKKSCVEIYKRGRYLTLTGYHLPGTPTTVQDRQPQLDEFCRLVFGDIRNGRAGNGAAFRPTGPPETAEIEDALRYIDPDPRENWLNIGMALHRELSASGKAIWDSWSQRSGKFDAGEQDSTWNHFRAEGNSVGAVGIGTIFKMAQEAGWKRPRPEPAVIRSAITQPDRTGFNQMPATVNGNGKQEALPPLPAPMKASDWFREEEKRFENASYIWDGILEAGAYAMIGGKKGHGKSTFARTLALKISRGEEFMGRATERSKVWYLDFEPGGRGRIATLKSLGWCDDDWLELSTIPPPANHPDVFKWLRQYIVERGFKVIIVDTLFKLLRIDGANDYDKALYAQVPLEEICRELGVCIIVLHHARKNGQFSSQQSCAEQMLGATSIAGAACACILINHRGGDYTFRMDPPRYGTAIEGELVLELDVSGSVSEAGSWKRKWVSQTKQLVMQAAADQAGWFVAADLQVVDPEKGEPLSRRSLYWAIGELVKENLLEKGESLPPGRKGGKPIMQYRVMTLLSGAPNAPDQQDQKGLWS